LFQRDIPSGTVGKLGEAVLPIFQPHYTALISVGFFDTVFTLHTILDEQV
jgi:hypothetical protein